MEPPVLVIGEALIDIVIPFSGETVEHVGGSPANVAIGLARLGHPTELATHIGTDARGQRIAGLLEAEQVGLTAGSDRAERTPTAAAQLDAGGAARYEFDLAWHLDPELPLNTGHVHTGSIAATLKPGGEAVASIVNRARSSATISYDPNARPSIVGTADQVRDEIEALVGASDVVKASDEDIAWLYPGRSLEEVLRAWSKLGPQVCAVTRGGDGALVLVQGEFHQLPAPATSVVDTVGAGDSFMSGWLSGLLDAGLLGGVEARERLAVAGWDEIEPAVRRALACAAITVSRAGANPPTRAELPA
ncbi:MAG: carbohydrate kinase [Propionibacteriaceae bacterium]|nr:carbohydrate kinase [Propionibacteriaceae bacterium]